MKAVEALAPQPVAVEPQSPKQAGGGSPDAFSRALQQSTRAEAEASDAKATTKTEPKPRGKPEARKGKKREADPGAAIGEAARPEVGPDVRAAAVVDGLEPQPPRQGDPEQVTTDERRAPRKGAKVGLPQAARRSDPTRNADVAAIVGDETNITRIEIDGFDTGTKALSKIGSSENTATVT